MTLFTWSTTALTNNTADSTINWQEGQAARTLNNSARGMMAAVAKFRDDISGNLVTAGTSTAYTVTTNQVFTALTDGIFFYARMDETCGTDPTLAVDGLTAKQIEQASGTNVPSGSLVAGAIYAFAYDSTADSWIVHGNVEPFLTTADNADLVAIEALSGTGVAYRTASDTWSLDDGTCTINVIADNVGNALTTGVISDIEVPFDCTIKGVKLLADQSGSIVIDIWKDTYANYPPTNADSITASAPPTISSTNKSSDSTLTGWTTSVSAGDILRFNIDSITTLTRISLALEVERYT